MSNMVVNTNVLALNSHRALKNVGSMQAKASARLSSGQRINTAADDAAGLAISEKMRAQVRGLDMASKNAQDGISLIQTAEGGLQEINNMVQRVRELSVQSANDTNTGSDRALIQKEVKALQDEITAMTSRTEFNTKGVLKGGADGTFTFQIGANKDQTLTIAIEGAGTSTTAIAASDVSTQTGASAAIAACDTALEKLAESRAQLGAWQNRLEYTGKSLDISSENLSASESRIRDADMAKEMMNLTKANVLQQAATSMLSQANQAPQNVLQLLR